MSAETHAAFIGRTRTGHDMIEPWRVEALSAALDLDLPHAPGDPLPLPFHFTLFRETTTRAGTAADGHARRGDFLPPIDLPSRMFAGARMICHAPLLIGGAVECVERIAAIEEKSGASGPLVIVKVAFEYRQEGRLCLSEERDLIYRAGGGAAPPQPAAMAPVAETPWSEDWEIDPVLLFRYSALTFNSHRIHYDLPYARDVEGYPGLVVHGPLLATLLCRLAEARAGCPIRAFSFRAMRPFFLGHPVRLRGGPEGEGWAVLEALTPAGETGMRATFEFG